MQPTVTRPPRPELPERNFPDLLPQAEIDLNEDRHPPGAPSFWPPRLLRLTRSARS